MMDIMGELQAKHFLARALNACYVLATGLKAGYTKLSKTGSSPALRKFTEQRGREPLRNAWPSTCSRDQGSEEKKPQSPQLKEIEPGWTKKDPASRGSDD